MIDVETILKAIPDAPTTFGEKNYLLAIFPVDSTLSLQVWLIQNPLAPQYPNPSSSDSPSVDIWKLENNENLSYLGDSTKYVGKLTSFNESTIVWYFYHFAQIGYNGKLLEVQRSSPLFPSPESALELGCTRTGMEYLFYTPVIPTRIGASPGFRGFWTPEFSYNTQQEN